MFDLSLREILKLPVKEQTIYKARKEGYTAMSKGEELSYTDMLIDSAYADWMRQGAEIYAYGSLNVLGHNDLSKE